MAPRLLAIPPLYAAAASAFSARTHSVQCTTDVLRTKHDDRHRIAVAAAEMIAAVSRHLNIAVY